MKPRALVASAALMIIAPAHAEVLTLDSVAALASIGIGDEAIIAKIKSSGTHIDLSTEQMIMLKSKGVSGPVIAALLSRGDTQTSVPTYSLTSADPMVAHPPGVYLLAEGGASVQRIDPTTTNQAKTGGLLGYAMTGGIASMSVKAAIQNPTARVQSKGRRPVFHFYFDESNPGSSQAATWLSGTAATVTSPSEFTLIRLMKKNDRREARVGSVNIGGAKTGVMDKDRVAFQYDMIRPGVFKVTPTEDLTPGEYGFIYSLSGGGAGGAMTARIFDFGSS